MGLTRSIMKIFTFINYFERDFPILGLPQNAGTSISNRLDKIVYVGLRDWIASELDAGTCSVA